MISIVKNIVMTRDVESIIILGILMFIANRQIPLQTHTVLTFWSKSVGKT